MAIAGGVTTAYRCWLDDDGELLVARTSAPRSQCVSPAVAIEQMRAGDGAMLAGRYMAALRALLARERDDGPARMNEVANEHIVEDE
tara:strand:- start:3864 stop:4124 length:261 start_codon:yes stop_codon:yes gene_type:complete